MRPILILAAILSFAPAAASAADPAPPDRSLSDSDRLRDIEIAIRAARAGGEIDEAAARELQLGVARTRRQMIRMGMQVGYRQRVRIRQRIDGLQARLEARRALAR